MKSQLLEDLRSLDRTMVAMHADLRAMSARALEGKSAAYMAIERARVSLPAVQCEVREAIAVLDSQALEPGE